MTTIVVPPQWNRLDIQDLSGTVMVIGASDTGKSTLARFLFTKVCQQGVHAAYLDADMGQSTLGVPTTMTVALATRAGDACFPPQGVRVTYFAGATTPRRHMLPTVIGTYRLQQKALSLGAEVVVVDTTGLVDKAQGGKALKQWKIELLAPTVVLGLQRDRELEPILWPLRRDGRVRSVEMGVSPHVVERSREARIARRQEQLNRYFQGAQQQVVALRQMAIYDLERMTLGSVVAFQNAEGFAVGLGAVEEVDRLGGTIIVRTPLSSLQTVASIRVGAVHWDVANRREW